MLFDNNFVELNDFNEIDLVFEDYDYEEGIYF